MIPLKLQIKNFLSYGSDFQTIDFEPYNMICLSGKNGHGKSALLDALTWALWGQARKITGVAKADEGLLRLGQQQMVVVLSFTCNGQLYQVRREYNKGNYGKAYVNLDFGIFDETKQAYVPVAGKSVRSAQAAIEDVVRLDFDSFCNSAFLRQGQSNEFSKKSPKERKEVLGAILGLSQYEAIRKLASEKVRETMTERIALQTVIDRTKQELPNITVIEQTWQLVVQQLLELGQQESIYGAQKKDLQQQLLLFADDQRQKQQQLQRIVELQKSKEDLLHTIRTLVHQWRSVHAQQRVYAAQGNIEERRRALLDELNKQQERIQEGLTLRERLLDTKRLLHDREQAVLIAQGKQVQAQQIAIERLLVEQQGVIEKMGIAQRTMATLNTEQKQLELAALSIQKEAAASARQCETMSVVQLQFEKRKACYQQMITQGKLLQHEVENLAHKQLLSEDEANPSCPLCEQNLSASRRRFLRQKFAKDEHLLRHRLARITRVVQKLKQLLIEQHEQLKRQQVAADTCKTALLKNEELTKQLLRVKNDLCLIETQQESYAKEIEASTKRIATEQETLEQLQKAVCVMVQSDEQYCALRQQFVVLEQELANHGDDARLLQDIRGRLQLVEQQISQYQELLKQSSLQEQRKNEIAQLNVQYKKYVQEARALLPVQEQLQQLLVQQQSLRDREQETDNLLQELMQRKEAFLQEKGSLENQRKKLNELDAEYRIQQKRLHEIEGQLDDLQAIIAATGKDGIQALLIQDVLPEIEAEANQLIAKLTDNQAQIFVESLRDLKKGGTKETLDINISDGLGIRPYEMFSGGEAFRIDFALRIAMSKLLARRAGTSLQTLIIDEGFGSQDEEGLALIMDALYKIQDDFAKVIVVSHLASMKDQFPVQFYVEKRATGSQVEIIEQG